MRTTTQDNTTQVVGGIQQKGALFLRLLTDEVVKTSTPKTPRRLGDLRQQVVKQVLGLKGRIIWASDHAVYQEEKQYGNYTTPGTGPHFAKNAVKDVVNRSNSVARRAGIG